MEPTVSTRKKYPLKDRVYHTDPDCPSYQALSQERTLTEAEAAQARLCSYCDSDRDPDRHSSNSLWRAAVEADPATFRDDQEGDRA